MDLLAPPTSASGGTLYHRRSEQCACRLLPCVHAGPRHGGDPYSQDGRLEQLTVDVKREPAMLPAPRSGPDQWYPVIPVYSGPGGRVVANLTAGRFPRGDVRP
jgi:hypothetical protein